MGRDLIKRYSKISLGNIFTFLNDVYKTGKTREFISFTIWEAFHKAGLFPKKSYIQFNTGESLVLKDQGLPDQDFEEKVQQVFTNKGLNLARSAHSWKRIYISNAGELFGYLDLDDRSLYKSADRGETVVFIHTFPEKIKSIFVSSQNTILVSVKGGVYRGSDNGEPFQRVIELGSQESFFRHSYAVTETPDKTLIIGEYGNLWEAGGWRKLANLYFSYDDGKTWEKSDFLIQKGTNKHVHIIRYSQLLNKLLLCDGDNYKRVWVSDTLTSARPESIRWKPITRFHIQTGGYTSVVESNGKILFGTDYQGGTNFIVETTDGEKFTKRIVPDPYRKSPIHSLVPRKSARGNEIWANLPISVGKSKCLLMFTTDAGKTWNKVIEYNNKVHSVSLISAASDATQAIYCAIEDVKNNHRVVYKISDIVN